MKLLCVNLKTIPQTSANIVILSEWRDGHTSRWRESSFQLQRAEALAIFERELIIRFQQTSKAAALCVRALLGGVKRTL